MNKYTEIKDALQGGLKTNNYRIILNVPTEDKSQINGSSNTILNILCQSTSFPVRKISTNSVFFRGRKVVLRSLEEFDETWSCTFVDDYNSNIRRLFENWLTGTDSQERQTIWTNYQTDMKVIQLSPEGFPVFGYLLSSAFVSNISGVDFSDEKADAVKLTITFSYSKCSIIPQSELTD